MLHEVKTLNDEIRPLFANFVKDSLIDPFECGMLAYASMNGFSNEEIKEE